MYAEGYDFYNRRESVVTNLTSFAINFEPMFVAHNLWVTLLKLIGTKMTSSDIGLLLPNPNED